MLCVNMLKNHYKRVLIDVVVRCAQLLVFKSNLSGLPYTVSECSIPGFLVVSSGWARRALCPSRRGLQQTEGRRLLFAKFAQNCVPLQNSRSRNSEVRPQIVPVKITRESIIKYQNIYLFKIRN